MVKFRNFPPVRFFVGILPISLWEIIFFVLPVLLIFIVSFLIVKELRLVFQWTLENYTDIFSKMPYWVAYVRSFRLALTAVVLSAVLAYPLAYAIAFVVPTRIRRLLMVAMILPFWTSDLIRTYAWMLILRDTGLLNNLLQYLHIIREPLTLLYTEGAILMGLAYVYLPFMVLPLYASIEKLDPSLLEAAEDLGATPFWRFVKVTVPLTKSGILAGSLLVFIPSVGVFVVSDLLGGAKAMMIGNLVQLQFGPARNWPFGSAASFILMAIVLFAVFAYLKFAGGKEALEEAQ